MRPFVYSRADNIASAVQAMGTDSTQILAGGTTLLDLMKLDVLRPAAVVDINGLKTTYGAIAVSHAGLRLGALVSMSEAASHDTIRRSYPVIADSLYLAASPQIRNMATLGGNVLQRTRCNYFRETSWSACNKRRPGSGCAAMEGVNRRHAVLGVSDACIAAYPGDFAQALVALGAMVEINGPRGQRKIPVEALHRLPGVTPDRETVLEPGDIITAFEIPAGPWTRRSAYVKIRDRESYEFALASAAVALHLDGGMVQEARIAIGGVATKPWRCHEAEQALKGKPLTEENAAHAAQTAFTGAVPRSQNRYKIELGRRTIVRALLQAAAMEV